MRDPRDEPTSFNPVEYADEQRRARLDREYWEDRRAAPQCEFCGPDCECPKPEDACTHCGHPDDHEPFCIIKAVW